MKERCVENLYDSELIMNALALLLEQPIGRWGENQGERMDRVYRVHDELVKRSSTKPVSPENMKNNQ